MLKAKMFFKMFEIIENCRFIFLTFGGGCCQGYETERAIAEKFGGF